MKYYTTKPGSYPDKKPQNSDNEYFGNGWSVKRDGNNYYLSYISGSLQGQLKTINITRQDFELARSGKIDLDQLCTKYNVS